MIWMRLGSLRKTERLKNASIRKHVNPMMQSSEMRSPVPREPVNSILYSTELLPLSTFWLFFFLVFRQMKKNPEVFKNEIIKNVKKSREFPIYWRVLVRYRKARVPTLTRSIPDWEANIRWNEGADLEKIQKLALEHKQSIVGRVAISFICLHRP